MYPCHRQLASSRGLRSWMLPRWQRRQSSGCSRSPPAAASALPHLFLIPGPQPARRQSAVESWQRQNLLRRSGGHRRGTTPRSPAAALPPRQQRMQRRRWVPRRHGRPRGCRRQLCRRRGRPPARRRPPPFRHRSSCDRRPVLCSRRSRLPGRLRRHQRQRRSPEPELLCRRCSSRSTQPSERPSDRSTAHPQMPARPRSSPVLAQRLAA